MNDTPNMCEKHKDKTNDEIVKIINRHPATIDRELKRNKGLHGYRSNQANKKVGTKDKIQDFLVIYG